MQDNLYHDSNKFSSSKPYERYKTEINAWSLTTSVSKEKQGLHVALSLPEDDPSNIRDKVFTELELEKLNKDDGLNKLLEYFEKQFGKDDMSVAYEKYVEFEQCKRQRSQKVTEFILEFEQKYNACTKKGKKYPGDILAMKLIDSCNLTTMERKIVLTEVDYTKKEEMFESAKSSLRKFVGEQVGSGSSLNLEQDPQPAIKVEAFITEHEDVLIAHGWRKRSGSDPLPYSKNFQENQKSFGRSAWQDNGNTYSGQFNKRGKKKFTNPVGVDGSPRRCFYCESIMHLKQNCPHRGQKLNDEQVILYTKIRMRQIYI